MIDVLKTKTGDYTLRWSGRLLASQVDPRAEAAKWVQQVSATLRGCRTVFVIGAGAGYHLLELAELFPHISILVLEKEQKIINAVRASLEISFLGVDFIATGKTDVFANAGVRKALAAGTYRVLIHPSARVVDAQHAVDIAADLNGRTPHGFQEILDIREDSSLELLSPPDEKSKKLLSIRDLDLQSAPATYQALGELLK